MDRNGFSIVFYFNDALFRNVIHFAVGQRDTLCRNIPLAWVLCVVFRYFFFYYRLYVPHDLLVMRHQFFESGKK